MALFRCILLVCGAVLVVPGCGAASFLAPPWHFSSGDQSGSDSDHAPQTFIDQANRDFETIMPAYESGTYPDKFDARFADGPELSRGWFSTSGYSVRSYFDPHLRYQELLAEYKQSPYGGGQAPLDDWKEGYFNSQNPSTYIREFPHEASVGSLNDSLNTIGNTEKLFGFIWKNDFSQSARRITASPDSITFSFTWKRFVQVPGDVSMTGAFKEQAVVELSYDHNLKLTSVCRFPESWGVSPLH